MQHTIEAGRKIYTIKTGDELKLNSNRKAYTQKRNGVSLGSIPNNIVKSIWSNLKEINPYPLTFEVE